MLCRVVGWSICTFVAVVFAADSTGQDSISGSDTEVTLDHLRTDHPESSTAEPILKVEPSTPVDLGTLLDAGEGALVVLVSGDTRLAAHRAMLSARSAVFQRLLQGAATGVVAVPDVEGPVLRQLLSYLYTLQAPQLPAMAPQLLAAAHQYGLPALKADCEQQVAKQLSVETAAATAVLAVRHSSDSLMKAALAYIRTHIFSVIATQGWEDAIKRQPEVLIKVCQLLFDSPAETSSSVPVASETFPYPAPQPQSDHSGSQTHATTTPTTDSTTTAKTVRDMSFLRSLSPEEKTRRLMEAAKQGAVADLEALLGAGADLVARDELNRSALHWAAWKGHAEAARRLLAAGADVDARSRGQWTPLHWAAYRGQAAVVRLLLANNADHGATDEDGRTPLHWAADSGHREAAAALLGVGADRGARDNRGNTPLDLARRSNHQQLVELLQTEGGPAAAM